MTQQSTPAAKSAAGNAPHSPANRPVRLTAWKLTGLWRASHNNKLVAVKDFDTEKSVFSSKLSTAAFTDQTIGRSYDGAITRLVRIEAKRSAS